MGVRETEGSITMKIDRGIFPVRLFLAALIAIGCPQVRLEYIQKVRTERRTDA